MRYRVILDTPQEFWTVRVQRIPSATEVHVSKKIFGLEISRENA